MAGADPQNIAEFKSQLMNVIAPLYKIWPDHDVVETDVMPESGIKLLLDEGILHGTKLDHQGLFGARLTRHAVSVLQVPERNAGGELLGNVVVNAVESNNENERRVVAKLLAEKLLNI